MNTFEIDFYLKIEEYINSLSISTNFNLYSMTVKDIKDNINILLKYIDISFNNIYIKDNNKLHLIDAFDIPINFIKNNDIFFGKYNVLNTDYNIGRCIFNNILLNENITNVSPMVLIHEMAHIQLLNYISINNNYNNELISLLLEKIYSIYYDYNLFIYNEMNRLKIIKETILLFKNHKLNDHQMLHCKYIVDSIIISEYLFYNYNYNNKDAITSLLQNIFDGKITVEILIDTFKINIYNINDFKKILDGNISFRRRF